jgi:hypothetical protein
VIDQIRCFFRAARRVSVSARRNELGALFTDFLETEIAVGK